ncbi:MAG: hypothetical protein AAAFM81_10570 [Pseudomonadota bacterium]
MSESDGEFRPYAPPAASNLSDAPPLATQLLDEQSLVGTVVGAVSGGVPGYVFYTMVVLSNVAPAIAFFIPGVVIGFGAKWVGRGLTVMHALVAAGIALLGLLSCLFFVKLTPVGFLMSLPNVLIAGLLAKRSLTREQAKALYDYRWQHGAGR